jgi:hypothetical protein
MDKIRVSVQFSKYLYTCSQGHELFTDDNTKTYDCSICGQKLGEGWYRNVGDALSFSKAEYDDLKVEDLEKAKQARIDTNVYNIKNPPAQEEITKEMLEAEKAQLEERVSSLTAQIEAKG